MRNTAFLTSHTPTQIHTIPPQSSPLILDQTLQAHTHIYTHTHTHKHTHKQLHAETLVQNICRSSTQETRCVQCWLSLLCVRVCVCTYMRAHTSLMQQTPDQCQDSRITRHLIQKTQVSFVQTSPPSTLHGMTPRPPHVCAYCTFRRGTVCA